MTRSLCDQTAKQLPTLEGRFSAWLLSWCDESRCLVKVRQEHGLRGRLSINDIIYTYDIYIYIYIYDIHPRKRMEKIETNSLWNFASFDSVRQLSEFASDLVSVLIHIASVEVLPAVVLNEIVAAGEIQIQLCFLRYGNFMTLWNFVSLARAFY